MEIYNGKTLLFYDYILHVYASFNLIIFYANKNLILCIK
jgi:hypothetical protein